MLAVVNEMASKCEYTLSKNSLSFYKLITYQLSAVLQQKWELGRTPRVTPDIV